MRIITITSGKFECTTRGTKRLRETLETKLKSSGLMEESQYNEIIKRLERIEGYLKPLEEDTSYGKKILANIMGNLIWEWLSYGTKDSIIHPPKL